MKTIYVVVEDYHYDDDFADCSDAIKAFTVKEKADRYIEDNLKRNLYINEVLLIED